ncbi:hypothetical protein J6590_050479 [Homalodisca vitripennis]|nr:hypothetical protein J6590_050479 [Homalodisca vitripennis]
MHGTVSYRLTRQPPSKGTTKKTPPRRHQTRHPTPDILKANSAKKSKSPATLLLSGCSLGMGLWSW